MAAHPELAAEQAHLDRTYEAYEALLRALSVTRRDRHGDEFTEEVLEKMINWRAPAAEAFYAATPPTRAG